MKKIIICLFMLSALAITATAKDVDTTGTPFASNDDWAVYGFNVPMYTGDPGFTGLGGVTDWAVTYGELEKDVEWQLGYKESQLFNPVQQVLTIINMYDAPFGSELPPEVAIFSLDFAIVQKNENAKAADMLIAFRYYTTEPIDAILVDGNAVGFNAPGKKGDDGWFTFELNVNDILVSSQDFITEHVLEFRLKAPREGIQGIDFGVEFNGENSHITNVTPEPASCILLGALALGAFPFARRFRNK